MLCALAVVVGCLSQAATAAASEPFGIRSFSVVAQNRDGSTDIQAGSYPYQLVTEFTLNGIEIGAVLKEPSELLSEEDLKDTRVELPAGFLGNPQAVPRCSYQLFISGRYACPADTAVGFETVFLREENGGVVKKIFASNPIYNLVPPPGVAAELGFQVKGLAPVLLDASVRTGGDYGVTVDTRNITEIEPIYGVRVTIWGVPADPSHDPLRGGCLKEESEGVTNGSCPVTTPPEPFLINPTACGTSLAATITADSWQQPGQFVAPVSAPMPALSGCESLAFHPTVSVQPTTGEGSTPTALNADVRVPQEALLNPAGLVEAEVENTTVALPEGMELNPSAANGLLACSEEQLGLNEPGPATCPEASKVGNVTIRTPLLADPIVGGVYLAQQGDLPGNGENPFGSFTALYVVAEDKQAGVRVKLAGEVTLDAMTGRLTTTFRETPQVPFEDLMIAFFGGPRAPVTTPALCGSYTTQATLEPWSQTPAVSSPSSFKIESGPHGAPCRDPLPFTPGFQAGTTEVQAGGFAPFTVTLARPDGDQALGRVSVTTPQGLLGMLSSVELCGEPRASTGKCGPGSLIGKASVRAGLGGEPVEVTSGRVYITGPYEGAPFGLSIVVPAVAGPFNVGPGGGPVVVRARIKVDPRTSMLTATSDPLPTRLDGVALQLHEATVTIDRPSFMFNPTDCEAMAVTGTIFSDKDAASAPVSYPFHTTNCAVLPFKPTFTAATQGATSKADGASLTVTVAQIPGEANIHKVDLTLPKALPARLTTLQKACTAAQFVADPAGCPPASNIGSAIARTPVLRAPLTGPAYLVSHGGAAFPDVEFVLQGEGVTIVLDGGTDIKQGITYSKFETVPDAPITSFETILPEGPHSALAAPSGNLCGQSLDIPTTIAAQDGATLTQATSVAVTGCPRPRIKLALRKVGRTALALAVTTTQPGAVTFSGPLVKTARKRLGAGVHRVTVALTSRARATLGRRRATSIRATIRNSAGVASSAIRPKLRH